MFCIIFQELFGECKKLKTTDIDMLHGRLLKNILLFTMPIALSSIVQQLFNAADTAVVGYFGNTNALAAVGANTEIISLIITISSGLSIGANILIAKQLGRNNRSKIPHIVSTAILLSLIIGAFGMILGQFLASPLLHLIETPEQIFSGAEKYLRIYMLGYPFLLIYDFGSAILRARGDSRYPFLALVISGVINVILNLFFVISLNLGVIGVSVATDISSFISAVLVLYRLSKDDIFQFSLKNIRFTLTPVKKLLKTGVPSAIQGAVFCFANIFVQASVNTFGETAIAGSTIAMNFEYFTYYIITAFGQTTTTFISQNHAAGKKDRCKRIFLICLVSSIIYSSIPIFTLVVFRRFFSDLFTANAAVIESASLRILCILLFEPLCNLYEIPAGVMRGSGRAIYPAVSTVIGTCAFRIIWICTVFQANNTLSMLYHVFPLSWIFTIVLVNIGFIITFSKSFKNQPQ